MSVLPVGEVCQVATMLLKTIRAVGETARNHKEALPRILMLEGTLKQLTQVEAREQKALSHKKHHVEQANALESLQGLCQQLEVQVNKAKRIASKKGVRLKLYTLQGALFGVCELQRIAKMMESLITSWLKLQNLPSEVREALQKNAASLPVILEVQSDHGYQPLMGKSEEIKERLQNSENKVLLIHGMTGIGKSSLARYVASDPPERFSDGALELAFGQACSIPAANDNVSEYHSLLAAKLCVLLRKLGCNKEQLGDGLNLDNACHALQELLTGKSYLIILDDVWEVDITPRLTKLSGNSCKMLVTTRIESVHAITEADKVEIKESDVVEVGRSILKYHTQLEELPDLCDALLQKCGYHPLTISVIGEALNGETRLEEWEKAIENLSMYAANASVPAGYQTGLDATASTVFGSFQFSLRALPKDARLLFTVFSLFQWNEPIPETCLEKVWAAFRPKSLFRLEVAKLVKGSLVTKPDASFCYRMHDMVSLLLDNESEDAEEMLQFSEICGRRAGLSWVVAAAWLVRYGRAEIKKRAGDFLSEALRSDIHAVQVTVLNTVVELLDLVSSLTELSITSDLFLAAAKYKAILDIEIIYLVACGGVHADTSGAIAHYMANVYAPKDYKSLASELINRGVIQVLTSVFRGCGLTESISDSNYEALNVLYELVQRADSACCEALLRDMPLKELVDIHYVPLSMDMLERLCEMGGENMVAQIFETHGLWEKLARASKRKANLPWPRRERSIIKETFLRMSEGVNASKMGSAGGSMSDIQVALKDAADALQKAISAAAAAAAGSAATSSPSSSSSSSSPQTSVELHGGEQPSSSSDSSSNGDDHVDRTADDGEAAGLDMDLMLEKLRFISTTLRGMRGGPARAWEDTVSSSLVTQSLLQALKLLQLLLLQGRSISSSSSSTSNLAMQAAGFAAQSLWEINYHPSSIKILEEACAGEALDNLLSSIASSDDNDDDDDAKESAAAASFMLDDNVACNLFEVLETLMNCSRRQEEVADKGGVKRLLRVMMTQGERRPQLQEKVLFYLVFSPLHVKREAGAWVEHLIEQGVVEALAMFPTVKRSARLPVLPFWFLCKFGTSIAKTDKLAAAEQARLGADFMARMKAALPGIHNRACGQDISSIEELPLLESHNHHHHHDHSHSHSHSHSHAHSDEDDDDDDDDDDHHHHHHHHHHHPS